MKSGWAPIQAEWCHFRKRKKAGDVAQWHSACLACTRLWLHSQNRRRKQAKGGEERGREWEEEKRSEEVWRKGRERRRRHSRNAHTKQRLQEGTARKQLLASHRERPRRKQTRGHLLVWTSKQNCKKGILLFKSQSL